MIKDLTRKNFEEILTKDFYFKSNSNIVYMDDARLHWTFAHPSHQDDIIKNFIKKDYLNHTINRLLSIKKKLMNCSVVNIYIDGSVKDNGSVNISSIFGLHFYNEN